MKRYLFGLITLPVVLFVFNFAGATLKLLLNNVHYWREQLYGWDFGEYITAGILTNLVILCAVPIIIEQPFKKKED